MTTKCCGNCVYLGVVNDKDGKRRVRKGYTYACLAPTPDFSHLAESYQVALQSLRTPLQPARREASDGATCPVHSLLTN